MYRTNVASHKILVIEDDPDIRILIKQLLVLDGFEITMAEDGQAGLDHLGTTQKLPDLILLDLFMPHVDGYTFRETQKKTAKIAEIPVIVMTANQVLDLDVLQVAGILRKPVTIEELTACIRSVLHSAIRV